MKRFKGSLVWKLTIWFLLLSFLPLAVLAIFTRHTVSETFSELASDDTLSQVKLLANEVSSSTDDRDLQALLARFVKEDQFAFLVAEGGNYLAHSDGSKVGGSVGDDFSAQVAAELAAGGERVVTESTTGRLVGFSPVPGAFSTAVLIVDGTVVSTPMGRIQRAAAVQLAVSLVLVAVAGGTVIWFVFKPVQKLTKAAEELGAGNLDVQIDSSEMEGELEVLALAFNQMSRQLRGDRDELEQRVEERTEELRRIQEAERRLAEESAFLSQVGQIVSSTLDIDEVYERFAAEMKKLVDFDRLAINIIDHEAGVFVFRYASGLLQPGRQVPDVVALKDTQTEHVIATGKPLIRGGIASNPPARDELSVELGFRSSIMVPLFHKGRILGTLSLRSRRFNTYGSREQSVLERLSDYITPAIANAELYSQQTKAEEALRESEERFRALFEDSRDAIFISSPEGKFIDLNQAALDLFGLTRDEAIGANVAERYANPADQRRFQRDIVRSGVVRDFEEKLLKKDGTEMDCLVTATRRPAADSDSVGEIQGIIRDITERKRAEETLLQQARELAVLEERSRMAREIHDTLAQGFTGIFLQLEAGEQALSESPDEVAGHLSKAKILARESLQEARRSVWDLLPHALEQLDLVDALQQAVDQFAAAGGEQATLKVAGEIRELMPTVQTAILRICQESLTNVRRHAEANRVDVTLTFQHKAVYLAVQDDGQGFDTENVAPESAAGGFGLTGMGQRAKQLDGALAVKSAKGKGTLVEVTIPTL